VLDSFGNMCGNMVQKWLAEHMTMETISQGFTSAKLALDNLLHISNTATAASNTAVAASNTATATSQGILTGTETALVATNTGLTASNTAVAASSVAAAGSTAASAGVMSGAASGIGAAFTAILAPIGKFAATMATLAISTGAVAASMSIIALTTGLYALEAVLANLATVLFNVQLGIMATTATITGKALATLAIANAANSAAQIPMVGWMLAPGAALSTAAGIMAADTMVQFREKGGEVKKGQAYIVGEKRPELFVPDRNGRIEPNLNSLQGNGGSSTQNTYSTSVVIQAIDTKDFKQRVGDLTEYIHGNIQKGVKKRQLAPLGG